MNIFISENIKDNIVFHGSGNYFTEFDEKFITSGHENQVHGYGFYFTYNKEIAQFYAKELKNVKKESYIYTVRLYRDSNFLSWEDRLDFEDAEHILKCFEEEHDNGDIDDLKDALGLSESYYGDLPTAKNIYDHLKYDLGGEKNVSKFLYDCGIDGFTFTSKENGFNAKNVVVFSKNSIAKIINVEKI